MVLSPCRRLKGLAAMLMLIILVSGCGRTVQPLALNVSSKPASMAEEITITLENPDNRSLFVPVNWAGIEIYRAETNGDWVEYMSDTDIAPMFSTTAGKLVYSIPAGTFAPGIYKLVIRGRVGKEGTSFTLETNLDLTHFSPANIEDLSGLFKAHYLWIKEAAPELSQRSKIYLSAESHKVV